jgi:hypothetical protein
MAGSTFLSGVTCAATAASQLSTRRPVPWAVISLFVAPSCVPSLNFFLFF